MMLFPYIFNRLIPTSHADSSVEWSLILDANTSFYGKCLFFGDLVAGDNVTLFFEIDFSEKVFIVHTNDVVLQSILNVTQLSRNVFKFLFIEQQNKLFLRKRNCQSMRTWDLRTQLKINLGINSFQCVRWKISLKECGVGEHLFHIVLGRAKWMNTLIKSSGLISWQLRTLNDHRIPGRNLVESPKASVIHVSYFLEPKKLLKASL